MHIIIPRWILSMGSQRGCKKGPAPEPLAGNPKAKKKPTTIHNHHTCTHPPPTHTSPHPCSTHPEADQEGSREEGPATSLPSQMPSL